jgi:hypothetical protein
MGGIKSGQSRDTRYGKHNKETKKMRGIKSGPCLVCLDCPLLIPPIFLVSLLCFPGLVSFDCPLLIHLIFLVSLLSFPCLVSLDSSHLFSFFVVFFVSSCVSWLSTLYSSFFFSFFVGQPRDTRHGKLNKETKKMRWIKSGQPRDTRHGKLNKETKKMRGIKSGQLRDTRHGKHNKETKKMGGIKRRCK